MLSNLIPFIMLPILTRLYPTPNYLGLNDSVNIIVSFASQIAILGCADAMFRYYFENEDVIYRKKITSCALTIMLVSGFIVAFLLFVFRSLLSELVFADKTQTKLIIIGAITTYATALNAVVATPTRMNNQRGKYLIVNILTVLLSYGIAIPLVLNGWYVYALPLALMMSRISSVLVFWVLNRRNFDLRLADTSWIRKLLKLGAPVTPSFLFYWALTSAQRIIITNILGLEITGIYSVGAKMALISQIIYAAFAMGWQYFAFSTMKNKDQVQLISRVFDYLAGISFLAACCMLLLAKPLFAVLFEPAYSAGALIMPALFLAPLIQMLYQCIGSQFMVIKKTGIGPCCLAIGTIVAFFMDYMLIPRLGMMGGALAELFGYVTACLIMASLLLRKKLLIIRLRTIIAFGISLISLITYSLLTDSIAGYILASLSIITILILYRKDCIIILNTLGNLLGSYGFRNNNKNEET